MPKRTCFGCKHLVSKRDGSGGVTYFCGRLSNGKPSGVVLGESSLLVDDDPRPLYDDCFEK